MIDLKALFILFREDAVKISCNIKAIFFNAQIVFAIRRKKGKYHRILIRFELDLEYFFTKPLHFFVIIGLFKKLDNGVPQLL